MAEGFLNTLYGDRYEGFSAGIEPTQVNPHAVEVMAEIGIDISTHHSKSIEDFRGKTFNYVVTVCNHARETCPFFPGEKILHKGFEDPSDSIGPEDEILISTQGGDVSRKLPPFFVYLSCLIFILL